MFIRTSLSYFVRWGLFYRTSALHSTLVSFIGNDKLTSNGERKAKKREDANEILPPTLIVGTDDDCCCYETLSRALQTSALISTYSTAQHWLLILSISHFIFRPHLQYTVFSTCLLFTLILPKTVWASSVFWLVDFSSGFQSKYINKDTVTSWG